MSERARFLTIILQESERLSRLINQVLDLAKLDAGRGEWRVTDVDLAGVIAECAATTGQLFRDKDVRLELALDEGAAAGEGGSRPRWCRC